MTQRQAQKILQHLIDKNLKFCFLYTGELISREDCYNVLEHSKNYFFDTYEQQTEQIAY